MKTRQTIEKPTAKELAESFVFRTSLSAKAEDKARKELTEARKKTRETQTESQKLYAQVLQLRFLIEDYLKSNAYDENYSFSSFLKKYIRLNYKKNKDFAKDIAWPETELSSIISKNRTPNTKMMIRLELHSNNVISAGIWYRLLEKENEYEIQNDQALRQAESKFVKKKLSYD